MAGKSFSASIRDFGVKALEGAGDIYSESIQDVMETAQTPIAKGGRMPVKDGHLRNGLVSELNGAEVARGPESYVLVAADLKMGDGCRFAWIVAHALRQELGFVGEDSLGRSYNQEGKHFAGSAAAQFQSFVAKNAARLKQSG